MKKLKFSIFILAALLAVTLFAACEPENEEFFDKKQYSVCVTYESLGGSLDARDYRTVWAEKGSRIPRPGQGFAQGNLRAVTPPEGYRVLGWFGGVRTLENGKKVSQAKTFEYSADNVVAYDEDGEKVYEVTYGDEWDFQKGCVEEDMYLFVKYELRESFAVVIPAPTEEDPDAVSYRFVYTDAGAESAATAFNRPTRTGYTFYGGYTLDGVTVTGYYLDKEKTRPVTFPITHDGGDADKRVYLYTDWIENAKEVDANGNETLSSRVWTFVTKAGDMASTTATTNYYLMCDIEFGEGERIGFISVYRGVFEGNGHKITGLNVSESQVGSFEFGLLCGRLGAKAIVRNVEFENASYAVEVGNSKGSAYVGLIAGRYDAGAVIENVTATGTVAVSVKATAQSRSHYVGKLVSGDETKVLKNCNVEGVTATQTTVAQ